MGQVGQALLDRFDELPCRLVGVTDTTATVIAARGLEPTRIAGFKRARGALAGHARGRVLSRREALEASGAEIVVDALPSDPALAGEAASWGEEVLAGGLSLALASKQGLRVASSRWFGPEHAARLGCNAVLGGTGRRLQLEIAELRARALECCVVGSATSTLVIEALEAGADFAAGVETARARGVLETDPELDFRGDDAAVKLAIVAGALWGSPSSASSIPREDLRSLDPDLVAERARRGSTTRLVGRASADGELRLRYEEVPRGGELEAPLGAVRYLYRLAGGESRLHEGWGVGAAGTAEALAADVAALAAERRELREATR